MPALQISRSPKKSLHRYLPFPKSSFSLPALTKSPLEPAVQSSCSIHTRYLPFSFIARPPISSFGCRIWTSFFNAVSTQSVIPNRRDSRCYSATASTGSLLHSIRGQYDIRRDRTINEGGGRFGGGRTQATVLSLTVPSGASFGSLLTVPISDSTLGALVEAPVSPVALRQFRYGL